MVTQYCFHESPYMSFHVYYHAQPSMRVDVYPQERVGKKNLVAWLGGWLVGEKCKRTYEAE